MTTLGWDEAAAVIIAMGAFPVSLSLTRFLILWNSSRGIVGVDVHKIDRPKIPERCGAAIPLTLLLFAAVYGLLYSRNPLPTAAFIMVVGSAAVIGAVDDKLKLKGIYKPLLTLLCGLPIVVLGLSNPDRVYNPNLKVPLFGGFHLPIIYPLTIPIAISVTSNTVNMLDPLNGTMAGSVAIVSAGLLIGLLLTNQEPTPVFLYAGLLFSLLGFFYYNRYPSRAFAGNVGQLSVGAALGAIAIIGRVEIASIVAMFPHIQNSFFFLSRIKRFAEHRELSSKPTRLLDDGRLASASDPKAPLTLVRTVLVGRPASEPDIVASIFALFVFSSALGVITLLITG